MKNCSEQEGPRVQPWNAVQLSRSPWSQGLLKVNDQTGVGEALLFSSAVKCNCLHRVTWKPVVWIKRWPTCLV